MNHLLRWNARRVAFGLTLLLIDLAAGSGTAGVITAYNVNQAFIDNETSGAPTNPAAGQYTYGYSFPSNFDPLHTDGLVHTDSSGFYNPSVQGFYVPNNASVPAVVGNVTNTAATTSYGATLQAGQLLLHPGSPGSDAYGSSTNPVADADLRYTASTSGVFNISGFFSGLDHGGTDVHVYVNGASLFNDAVTFGVNSAFNVNAVLAVGDRVDFLVGPGVDGSIGSDSTGLFANIVATPEPATLGSLGIGALLTLGYAWRQRKVKSIS